MKAGFNEQLNWIPESVSHVGEQGASFVNIYYIT